MYTTSRKLAWIAVCVMLAGILMASILPLLYPAVFQAWDVELLRKANNGRHIGLDPFFRAITDSAAPVSIFIPVILLLCGYFFKNKTAVHTGLYFALCFIAAALTSCLVKHLVDKPRPFITYDFIQKVTSGGSPSFPSGHTTDAFVTAVALSLVARKWYVVLPAFTWAFLVAYSRICLGVHYPSDVMGGIFLGTVTALAGYNIFKKKRPVVIPGASI